jgi:hypothetical protein
MDTDKHGLGGEKECSKQFPRPNFCELIFPLENSLFIRVHPWFQQVFSACSGLGESLEKCA